MKKKNITLKIIAVLFCAMMISMIISTALDLRTVEILPSVSAQDAQAESCCEININENAFCKNQTEIPENQCKPGYFHSNESCSELSQCNVGVCVPREDGRCLTGKKQAECRYANNGDWYDFSDLKDVPQCQIGCCDVAGRTCALEENKRCVQDLGGQWDGTVTDIAVCTNKCSSEAYGCCLDTSGYNNKLQKDCSESGAKFFGNAVYCSSIFESGIKACVKAKADDRKLTNDCYCYDSKGKREGVAADGECNSEQICVNLAPEKGGMSETAECKSTNCIESAENVWPPQLKNGESTCLNVLPGHFNPGGRSSYLQNYILHCQNGVVTPDSDFDKNADRSKICVEGKGSDGLWHAKGIPNQWQECQNCGEDWSGGATDVFGYVPILGGTLSWAFGSLNGHEGICSGYELGILPPGGNCANHGAVEINEGIDPAYLDGNKFRMCGAYGAGGGARDNYDFDLWSPMGSCNPRFPVGRGYDNSNEGVCNKCGGGADGVTNLCTEEECEHLGDCQFVSEFTPEALLGAAGVSLALCGAAAGSCTLCGGPGNVLCSALACTPADAFCYGLWSAAGVHAWGWLLLWGVTKSIGITLIAGAGQIENRRPITVNGKIALGQAIVSAKAVEKELGMPVNYATPLVDAVAMYALFGPGASAEALAKLNEIFAMKALESIYMGKTAGELLASLVSQNVLTQAQSDAFLKGFGAMLKVEDFSKVPLSKEGWDKIVLPTLKEKGVTKEVAVSKFGSGWLKWTRIVLISVAIFLDIWSTSRAMNIGKCEAESKYTPGEKQKLKDEGVLAVEPTAVCELCGTREGQWWCTEERCKMLGTDCVWKAENNTGKKDGTCLTVKLSDISPPNVVNVSLKLLKADNTTNYTSGIIDGKTLSVSTAQSHDVKWVEIGVGTNENSYCKYDNKENATYDEMRWTFDKESEFPMSHVARRDINEMMSTDYVYSIYARCEDAASNKNSVDAASISFRLQPPPDYYPPEIQYVDPSMYVPFGTASINLKILAYDNNRVSECRYSFNKSKTAWNEMTGEMTKSPANCKSGVTTANACDYFIKTVNLPEGREFTVDFETSGMSAEDRAAINSQMADLRGSKMYDLFMQCQDNTAQKNAYSINMTLMSTSPFNISIAGITDKYSQKPEFNVTTSRQTTCTYEISAVSRKYTFDDPVYGLKEHIKKHNETLQPRDTPYTITVECKDIAGTKKKATKDFTVSLDSTPPNIIRAYAEEGILHLATDEKAICVYGTKDCSYAFDDGTGMPEGRIEPTMTHDAIFNTGITYYIKCKDQWENKPTGCTETIKPYEIAVL
jgi:hypothetical protein